MRETGVHVQPLSPTVYCLGSDVAHEGSANSAPLILHMHETRDDLSAFC